MKICILSRTPSYYTERRIIEEGLANDHEIFALRPSTCSIRISDDGNEIISKDGDVITANAVIPRIHKNHSSFDRAILRQLESNDVYTLAGSLAIERSFDMTRTLQLLSRNNILVPHTIIGGAQIVSGVALNEIELPVSIRLASTESDPVTTSNERVVKSLLQVLSSSDSSIILQAVPSINEGRSVKAVVLGSGVIASITKEMTDYKPAKLSDTEKKVILKIAKTLNINFCTIDITFYQDSYLITEIDVSPKLEMMEQVTGRNLARKLIEYIEQNAKRGQKKDKVGA
ncbi:MAG: hypothetical protein LBQ11_00025 [Candidatus Nomurabacteria bacterium]|jgi:ribosomal protein S6--L-glutamate ligase|nr:hypothetical protein [Candidatus Nomurabacteria bacterium]